MPGSQQGFRPQEGQLAPGKVELSNVEFEEARALALDYQALGPSQVAAVSTPTFAPRDVLDMRTYDLMATPLVYSGQSVSARVRAADENRMLKWYEIPYVLSKHKKEINL